MHKLLKQGEYAFDKFMDTEIIQHISCAQYRVKFNTMTPSPCSLHKKGGRYYNSLGFGINVYLRSHIDQDFTMSIFQAQIDNYDYQMEDRIICYLTFLQIISAVALWPGDFLLFNPQEPHSISSRCKSEEKVYVISSYLKTAVVGGHDNSNTVM